MCDDELLAVPEDAELQRRLERYQQLDEIAAEPAEREDQDAAADPRD